MASIANGVAHPAAEPSWSPRNDHGDTRPDILGQINAGGIGHTREFASPPSVPEDALSRYEKQYLPGRAKSLSGIAIRSFLLGLVLSASTIITLFLLASTTSLLWRLPFFIATLSLFHFLEFWTTAQYNTRAAQISSFLLSQNGSAYNVAHTAAMLECLVTSYFFPTRQWIPAFLTQTLIFVGLVMIVIGQFTRSIAMVQAGTNFNHIVQHRKANEHQLVTTGIYYYLRHPSYFGFFWWALGIQLVLGNVFCFIGYAIVLWRFFSGRISGEEELLVAFFGNDYVQYRKRTGVWIPLIS